MSITIFIPARFASTRFPGKPLVEIAGAGGVAKSLLQRSWEAAMAVPDVDQVAILTEDARIRQAGEAFGAEVIMTSDKCRNGTERCAEAIQAMQSAPDIVVNLQGDAPLTPAHFVTDLIGAMQPGGISVATPVINTDGAHLKMLKEERRAGRVGATTAVFRPDNRALYFSKEVVPHTGDYPDQARSDVFHHVGVYAYTPQALERYLAAPEGRLETLEGLEQLRFLELGIDVHCVEVDSAGKSFWEVNNPSDIAIMEAILKREGIA